MKKRKGRKLVYLGCPSCAQASEVIETDATASFKGSVRRRRECQSCGERFSTYEVREAVFEGFSQAAKLSTLVKKMKLKLESLEKNLKEIIPPEGVIHHV